MFWERELQALEKAIGDLNTEYDAFLFGSGGKPTIESRRRVEQLVKRLNAREPDSVSDHYRLATLQGRFNALCERWDRLLLEKEAGRRPGIYGGFARESRRAEAEPEPLRGGANAAESSSVQRKGAVDREAELFEQYLAARRSRGEDTRGYDLTRFKESLAREREKLQQRFGTAEVEFDVAEREGRVKLVARRRGESGRPAAGNGNEDQ